MYLLILKARRIKIENFTSGNFEKLKEIQGVSKKYIKFLQYIVLIHKVSINMFSKTDLVQDKEVPLKIKLWYYKNKAKVKTRIRG